MSVFKAIEFPDTTFNSKSEMFHALKRDQDRLISIKKAQIHQGISKGQVSFLHTEKLSTSQKSNFDTKADHIYPIISTTKFMDSHRDVHFDGCFNKTVKDQQGRVMYALDHKLEYDSILAWEGDVKMFVSSISWGIVGKSYPGETEALVFEIAKAKIRRQEVLSDIENKVQNFENSIRMVYHKIKLGINSEEEDLTENKAYYDSRIDSISNKEEVAEVGYFWGVEELGIHKEGSLVVAGGSNSATSIYSKYNEPPEGTQTSEPPEDTPKKQNTYHNFL